MDTLTGMHLRQAQLLADMDAAGVLNAKQLALALECTPRNAYRLQSAERLLDVGELRTILMRCPMPSVWRERMAALILADTGMVACDFAGRDQEHAEGSGLAEISNALTSVAEAIKSHVAAHSDGMLDAVEAHTITTQISAAMTDLAYAKHAIARHTKPARKPCLAKVG